MKLTAIFILFFSSLTYAGIQNIDVSKAIGGVSFLAVGRPSAIKIRGEGNHPTGQLNIDTNKINGILKFDLNSLKTGIDLRDHHMKEKYLETSKYPEAELTFSDLTLPQNFSKGDKTQLKGVPFTGKLKLKDKENDVTGHFDLDRDKKNLVVKAEFVIKLGDYNVEIPKYMGITVAEDVTVTTDLKTELTEK